MKERKDKGNLRKLKVLLIIVGIIVVPLIVTDIIIRMQFESLDAESQRIDREVMEPLGIKASEPNERGGGKNLKERLDCFLVSGCQSSRRAWYVPLENGKESEFIEGIINRYGYSVIDRSRQPCIIQEERQDYCYAEGQKRGDFRITIYAYNSESQPARSFPKQEVAPKRWRLVTLSIEFLPMRNY